MKAVIINGGPRKNWTTMKMLSKAAEGAKDAGAEVEIINLYDINFKGCISCLACKMKNSKCNGLCAIRDDLRPVLEKCLSADVIIMGSPIYFSRPTGVFNSFLERLMFPVLSYNPKNKARYIDKNIMTGVIYTMGRPKEYMDQGIYPLVFKENHDFLTMLFGHSEEVYAYATYQFSNYDLYEVLEGTEEYRTKHRDEELPNELQSAYELGKRLVGLAK